MELPHYDITSLTGGRQIHAGTPKNIYRQLLISISTEKNGPPHFCHPTKEKEEKIIPPFQSSLLFWFECVFW